MYFCCNAPDHCTNVRHAALFSAYLTVLIVELQRQLNFVVAASTGISLRSVVNYLGRFAAATCNGEQLMYYSLVHYASLVWGESTI